VQLVSRPKCPLGIEAGNLREYGNVNQCSPKDVKACVEHLRGILERGTVMQQKSSFRSFVRQIGIRNNEAEIEYTCPLLGSGCDKSEVLSIGGNGSAHGNRTRLSITDFFDMVQFLHKSYKTIVYQCILEFYQNL
jgi:hypothetical protein